MKTKTMKRSILKSILGLNILLTANAVMANGVNESNSYKISSDIYVDGKHISSPQMIVRPNQLASISLSNNNGKEALKMDLIARDAKITGVAESIEMKFNVEYKSGNETIHVKPVIIAMPNQKTKIKISDAGHICEVYAVASKQ